MQINAPALDGDLKPLRAIGFWGAVSNNILNMIGMGPFVTIPLALVAMGGPQAMLGWLLGAFLSVCDGLVWAELGSAMPQSGGPYHYLQQAFGPMKLGRLFGFLFLWQSLLLGPLNIGAGAVAFSDYAGYLAPALSHWGLVGIAALMCLLNTFMLYRDIRSIQRISLITTTVICLALVWLIVSGCFHFNAKLAFDFPKGAFKIDNGFFLGLGSTTLYAFYDYGGYNNVCLMGEEVKNPRRTIPWAVMASIGIVGLLYIGMNLSILGVIPWRIAEHSTAIAADFMQAIYGPWGGVAIAIFILIGGWGSVYAVLLANSRIPYAAAAQGRFFKPFAKLHPTGRFPTVSLLFMGGLSALACIVPLSDLIEIGTVMQCLFQFSAQCIAVILLRRRPVEGEPEKRFKMPLFPLPALITLAGYAYIVGTSKVHEIGLSLGLLGLGAGFYLFQARQKQEWPFAPESVAAQ